MGVEVSAAPAHRLHQLPSEKAKKKREFQNPLAVKHQYSGEQRWEGYCLRSCWIIGLHFVFLCQLWCKISQKSQRGGCQSVQDSTYCSSFVIFSELKKKTCFLCYVSNCSLDNISVMVMYIYINLIECLRNNFCYWVNFVVVRPVSPFLAVYV